ncbi:N-formylglutamate deformylase [Noviherbaspirillum pedocola]|uniref:N-formylglutamate deformylase n=1 Tax=Noviherbaspirillum pedocola TaxID=2801341 RepID=A0A934W9T4_9BURK|nr:N-formylglutamate deformylase [Noviherbaspirillum pedocola]MBK4738613.1 N-formylglutamate deformylase [Noviherbaspirillum pedocola]
MNDPIFNLVVGDLPILISIPHLGTGIPAHINASLTEVGRKVCDTDWHLDRLYGFATQQGASMISAKLSRYIIDLNRPPDGTSLYPGQTTTGLVPLETFHGEAVYLPGHEPDETEIQTRIDHYWKPYHEELARQIQTIKSRHGFVILWEAHSINGELPRLFEGVLPDLNFGTFAGKSAAAPVNEALREIAGQSRYSWVLNGRFKGGYITRHYGDPGSHVHAVQLEMSQRIYMNEPEPFEYREDLAARVQPVLSQLLDASLAAARQASDL